VGEVIFPRLISKLPIPPERVLEAAQEANLEQVVIIGFDKDGDWYFASSEPDSGAVIYHCSKAIHRLHKLEDEMSEG
jgi:hypothetical protein